VATAISQGNWDETQGIIAEAARKTRGNRRKKLTKPLQYLEENWAGIVTSPGAKRVGTIEGQIQHNVAKQMKRLGARWTISRGDQMARILAAKANGKHRNYTLRWPVEHRKLRELAQLKPVEKQKAGDVEKWLQASLPALKGPFDGRAWIKYVLQELSRPDYAALVC